MTVWLDGLRVYGYRGRRAHKLPNDRVPVELTPGPHRVLVRADQRRGDYDFSLKLCEVEMDPRYDGNAVDGLRWRVPEADPGTPVTEVLVQERPSSRLWWTDAEVDVIQRGHVRLVAFLPDRAPGTWAGLGTPAMWGNPMELTAQVDSDAVRVSTQNLEAFVLRAAGPVTRLLPGLTITIDDAGLRLDGDLEGETLCFARDAGTWRPSDPARCQAQRPLTWNPMGLRNDPVAPHWDTPLGNWFCDAILDATGADVALQNNGGIRLPVPTGDVTPQRIFGLNFRDELYTFTLTGAQLRAALEHDLRDGRERPLQVGGLRYTFDRSRPEGERIVDTDIDPARRYTVAAEDFLCQRAADLLGFEVEWTHTEVQIVDAQIRYAARADTLVAPPVGRILEVTPPNRNE